MMTFLRLVVSTCLLVSLAAAADWTDRYKEHRNMIVDTAELDEVSFRVFFISPHLCVLV
jgi:hypothetical protein